MLTQQDLKQLAQKGIAEQQESLSSRLRPNSDSLRLVFRF